MGPFLITARRAALGLLLGLGLTGLRCHSGCDEDYVELSLPASYTDYFAQFPGSPSPAGAGRPVDARSSTGLTDRYANVFVTPYGFPTPESYNCTIYRSEGRSLFYNPSLYPRYFRLSIAQYPSGPTLVVEEQFGGSATPSASEVYYPLTGTEPGRVRYTEPGQYTRTTYAEPPAVQTLPALTVAGRTYREVLRLTNPYAAQHGPATAAGVYYIDRGYGLVRFEQRDGTVWDLTP
ncbi:hypothetical protein LJ737_01425 [Hymenobacter sp. 15J16-1T3B]|uniref:hypothetical protein n=1 Tax=Hymenobacter sp. 15J16-1T3B TaxID=2886941 RepID=UPI001D12C8BB|nr:hypothetical protein [Hymenobacter sp. 15J16-1T3B]MCC3155878.1 hypothetical protein [Hymenobacter sp. 15J16-1T3B]